MRFARILPFRLLAAAMLFSSLSACGNSPKTGSAKCNANTASGSSAPGRVLAYANNNMEMEKWKA